MRIILFLLSLSKNCSAHLNTIGIDLENLVMIEKKINEDSVAFREIIKKQKRWKEVKENKKEGIEKN